MKALCNLISGVPKQKPQAACWKFAAGLEVCRWGGGFPLE